MPDFYLTFRTTGREVYMVTADNEEQAREDWGELIGIEEPVSAEHELDELIDIEEVG